MDFSTNELNFPSLVESMGKFLNTSDFLVVTLSSWPLENWLKAGLCKKKMYCWLGLEWQMALLRGLVEK